MCGVGGISDGPGDTGGKHRLGTRRRNPRHRRRKTGEGARRIRKKARVELIVPFLFREWALEKEFGRPMQSKIKVPL